MPQALGMAELKPTPLALIKSWIAATNSHDRAQYLAFFTDDAVLDDPSVGRKFKGKAGIGKYFDTYFVGYETRTRLVSVSLEADHLHVLVHFRGDFPGGSLGGTFDVQLRDDKISFVRADLVE